MTEAVTTSRSPAAATHGRWQPLGLGQAKITGGFWAPRQARNGEDAIPSGQDQLETAGNLQNLRLAAGIGAGRGDRPGVRRLRRLQVARGRRLGVRAQSERRPAQAHPRPHLGGRAAQREDGYLDSVVQLRYGDEGRYSNSSGATSTTAPAT